MRTPRRVPWLSLSELEQVCNWIYNDDHDLEAKLSAVNRISAWRAITPLPHALESTLSLLIANIEDQKRLSNSSASSSTLSLRQSYATAIVRLVNGLVDPLQQGVYARSISSIALKIGLPQWLVELRHAATHEELPSLELLRSGAGEALTWLLHNYFLPTLGGSTNAESSHTYDIATLSPLLKQYKTLMKLLVRDASLITRHKKDISDILKAIENWVSEAHIAASAVVFPGWGSERSSPSSKGDDDVDGDWRERWALEGLCDALLERGGLVPVSTKKRVTSLKSVTLPPELLEIWGHLLTSVYVNHPTFPSVLLGRILDILLQKNETRSSEDTTSVDRSRDVCLAGWANWIVEKWGDVPSSDGTDTQASSLIHRQDTVVFLVTSLGYSDRFDSINDFLGASLLLKSLSSEDPHLESICALLRPVTQALRNRSRVSTADENAIIISSMEDRLGVVLSLLDQNTPIADEPTGGPHTRLDSTTEHLPHGWGCVDVGTWKPSPIGTFVI